ncbi:MAG: hypothetical protein KDA57_22800, partial [Planctomycetales bacterium]|nr:hypothetical protein [Planctomycetales bacterium]
MDDLAGGLRVVTLAVLGVVRTRRVLPEGDFLTMISGGGSGASAGFEAARLRAGFDLAVVALLADGFLLAAARVRVVVWVELAAADERFRGVVVLTAAV